MGWGLNQFYSRETSSLILMQLQLQIYVRLHMGFSTSSKKHHSETHIKGSMAIWSQNTRKPQIEPR